MTNKTQPAMNQSQANKPVLSKTPKPSKPKPKNLKERALHFIDNRPIFIIDPDIEKVVSLGYD